MTLSPSEEARQAAIEQHDVEAHKALDNLKGEGSNPPPRSLTPLQLIKVARGQPRTPFFWRMTYFSMDLHTLTGDDDDA